MDKLLSNVLKECINLIYYLDDYKSYCLNHVILFLIPFFNTISLFHFKWSLKVYSNIIFKNVL